MKKVKLMCVDPTGVITFEREFDYHDFPKENSESNDMHYRYFLEIGEHVYVVDKQGRILSEFEK